MTNENTAQATLNAWQAQLQQVRQRRLDRGGGHAGPAPLHQVQGKTGLQVMTALLEGDCLTRTWPTPSTASWSSWATKTGPLRCVGAALHVGRQVGTSEARIVGPGGKLYAHATTTCAIFEWPPAAT